MRKAIFTLLCIAWAGSGSAADKLLFGAPPDWVQPVALPASEAATEAAVRVLLQDQQYFFSSDYDEMYFENVVRIQTPQGLAAMGTVSLPWKPETDTLTVHKLHILRDRQVIDVLGAGQTFTILRRENKLEYATLDGVLTAAIQPAGLQVGDALDIAFSYRRVDPVLRGVSEAVARTLPNVPIDNVHIRARWPSSSPISWKATKELPGATERRVGGMQEVSVSLQDVKPLPQSTGAPMRFLADRRIEFSGFDSWADVAAHLEPLYRKTSTLPPGSPLHAEIERIKAVSNSPEEQAAAALKLVQDQVRYVFLGMNDGGLVPAEPDLTWSRRFGDCKAKTVLLLALLKELGIQAEPVLVNSTFGDGMDARLPMIAWFDHVLVRATIGSNQYWMDGTRIGDRELSELQTPNYYWGLPLAEKGSALVSIVPPPLEQPTVLLSTKIDASAGIYLPAPFHAESRFKGDLGRQLKLQYDNMSPVDRDRAMKEMWSELYDFVEITKASQSFTEGTGEQVFTVDGVAKLQWRDGWWYEIPNMDVGFEADFSRPEGADANAPYLVSFPVFTKHVETVVLPNRGESFTTSGEQYNQVVAGIEYKRTTRIDREAGTHIAETSTRSVAREFPASEAPVAQRVLGEMQKTNVYIRRAQNYVLNDEEMAAEESKKPQAAKEFFDRGYKYFVRREYQLAVRDFSSALEMDSKHEYAIANRGMAYFWLKEPEKATLDSDGTLRINPRNAIAFRTRGMLALEKRAFEEAILAFTTSLEIEPRNVFALERRATAYMQARKFGPALADAGEVIQQNPKALEMYYLRGYVLNQQKKPDEAAKELEALVRANPKDPRAYASAGGLYLQMGKSEDAARAFDRAIEIAPSAGAYLGRANARLRTDLAGQKSDIDAALTLNPTFEPALSMQARIQMDSKQYAEAITTYGRLASITGETWTLLLDRGMAYAKSGQLERAEADFEASSQKAGTADRWNDICWTLATANVSLKTALAQCDKAIAGAPETAGFHDSRGLAALRLGNYGEAIASYDAALKAEPTLAYSLYGRGIARKKIGDASGAARDIEAAIAARASVKDDFEKMGVAQ